MGFSNRSGSRTPSYTVRDKHGFYYFRIVIPQKFRRLCPDIKREYRRSLHTHYRSDALRLSKRWWSDMQKVFAMASGETNPEKLKELLKRSYKKHKLEVELKRQLHDADENKQESEIWDEIAPGIKRTSAGKPNQTRIVETDANSQLLSEVIKKYMEMKALQGLRLKSLEENQGVLNLFLRIVGDGPFSAINFDDINRYEEIIQKLPANLNKIPRYRSKAIEDILKMKDVKRMSIITMNKNLSRIGGLFEWASNKGWIDRNYAKGRTVKVKEGQIKDVKSFTDEDLKKLILSDHYLKKNAKKHKQPYCFWLPLLAMFTGARLNELSQLHLSDVRKCAEIWCISINDDDEKTLKNKSSKRIVPIHEMLITLGFLDHVNKLKRHGEKRVFPELTLQRDGYGSTPSKWFARYSDQVGVSDPDKNFHSFRHTVSNQLKQKRCTEVEVGDLLGHDNESPTFGIYAEAYEAAVLAEVVKKISYDGLDFSLLSWP